MTETMKCFVMQGGELGGMIRTDQDAKVVKTARV